MIKRDISQFGLILMNLFMLSIIGMFLFGLIYIWLGTFIMCGIFTGILFSFPFLGFFGVLLMIIDTLFYGFRTGNI